MKYYITTTRRLRNPDIELATWLIPNPYSAANASLFDTLEEAIEEAAELNYDTIITVVE